MGKTNEKTMSFTAQDLLEKLESADLEEIVVADRFSMDDFPPFASYPTDAPMTMDLQTHIEGEIGQSPRHQFNISANLTNEEVLPTIAPKLGFES